MRTKYILLTIVLALVLSNTLPVYAATQNEREITIIEKKVCFDVTVSDAITNENVTKTICVVIAFHIKNAKPSNDTIDVEFPVYLHVGNKTVTKKVIVPLKIVGEVTRIEVKGATETGSEETENVIIVAPQETPTTTKPTTMTPKPTSTTTTSKPKTTTAPRTTPSKTTTKKPEEVTTMPMPPPRTTREPDVITVALILSIVVTGVGLYYIVMKRRKVEEKETRREEEKEDLESYKEALKMMKQQLEEKEKELQELKSSFTHRIYCPKCGESVIPAKTHDNRLLCPKCNSVLGRIRSDGTLEIFPSEEQEEKNEGKTKGKDKQVGEIQGRNNKETKGRKQED